MKPWIRDAILSLVMTVALGTMVLMVMPLASFFIFLSGIAFGYALRLSIVNVWPHIFTPRLAYKTSDQVDAFRAERHRR